VSLIRDENFWLEQRKRVCMPADTINLNAGSLSPTPIPVLAAAERLRRLQASTPSDFVWRQTPLLIAKARTRLAAYLHCPPANLALLPNVTHAINVAAESLQLKPGTEILITDHEYGAMVFCFQRLAAERGWTIRTLQLPASPESSAEIVAAIDAALTPATKVLLFSHVTSGLGIILPAVEICALLRKRGVLSVIDGAHAVGSIQIDLTAMAPDFYGGNCHKWMMAPLGAGFLFVRDEHKATVRPPIVSWGWGYKPAEQDVDSAAGGSKWQYALEFAGCTERVAQMVLPDTLDFLESLGGHAAIVKRVRELSRFTRESLAACGLIPATPANPELYTALIAFEFRTPEVGAVREQLWEKHRIECPIVVRPEGNYLRVSTAWFNTREEIERLAQAVKQEQMRS
jgi:isopenicillin-N epimerase